MSRLILVSLVLALVAVVVLKLAYPSRHSNGRIPMPVHHPIWEQRHGVFVEDSRSGAFEVVCLGDSLTWGWDDHRELWAERVTRRPTGFFAIGGDTTNNLLWRLNDGELRGPAPKLIILLIGTNNRHIKDDPVDIAESIDAVLAAIRTNAPTTPILLLGILPQGEFPSDRGRRVFAETNKLLAKYENGRDVFVRDIGHCLLSDDGRLTPEISPDGTHLSRLGYTRFAEALAPLVRERLGE